MILYNYYKILGRRMINMLHALSKLFSLDQVNLGIVKYQYTGKKHHW